VILPGGIVTVFEPGGGLSMPPCAAAASEHGGTETVSGPSRGEISTVRTPGFIRAVDTGSEDEDDELDDLDELPPQAARPVTNTALAVSPATRVAAELALVPMLLLLEVGRITPASGWLLLPCGRHYPVGFAT
jgi:hypothetical protein